MATAASSPFDDQTDEDFFDKLVNDDDGGEIAVDGSTTRPESSAAMTRVLSNLSIGGEEDGDRKENEVSISESVEAPKEEPLGEERDIKEVGSKGQGVRVVQWSSFGSVGFGSESDFFTKNSENAAAVSNEQQIADVNGAQYGGNLIANQQTADVNNSQYWDNMIGSSEQQQYAQFYGSENGLSTDVNNSQYWNNAVGSSEQQQDTRFYRSENEQSTNANDPQNWEDLYPGWKYDHSTGQWYQTEGDSSMNVQSDNYNGNGGNAQVGHQEMVQGAADGSISEQRSEISYLQHNAKSAVETVAEDWSQVSQGNTGYPPNMVFDPQYPEWYYDTNTKQWCSLESYNQTIQNTAGEVQDQPSQVNASNSIAGIEVGQFEQNAVQGFYGNHDGSQDWNGSANGYAQQSMWQPDTSVKSVLSYAENQQTGNFFRSGNVANHADQHRSFKMFEPVAGKSFNSSNDATGFKSFVPAENVYQFSQPKVQQTLQADLSQSYYTDPNSVSYSQQQFQIPNASHSQFANVNEGRSSAGRPAHALVTFGFGGKLIIMKGSSFLGTTLDHGSQDTGSGIISVLDLMEVVMDKVDALSSMNGSCGYFHDLCRQSFPGPLVGGNAAGKDVNRWIDEKIAHYESSTMDVRKGEALRLLLSLLKISCQHYGKLRSPFGTDPSLEGTDGPESALTQLFTVAKRNSARPRDHGSFTHCVQNIPSEGHILATAVEVQKFLVSGRRKEALHCAQAGQLWGPALVLAAQLGEKYYVETVKQMAQRQFTSGSPLRTLCLLIAGKPADVFSTDNSTSTGLSGAASVPKPTTEVLGSMLDDWEENLAIITANRTKDDELVMVHLGDCLWKERGEITAAHTCYLVAEANFESYSDTARLCLIGADHWNCPRTYACPEAIQEETSDTFSVDWSYYFGKFAVSMGCFSLVWFDKLNARTPKRTEIYEYSKVLGNSQFVLLQFQPYKLVYAHMLAEVGKISDSLRYCQTSLKLLKYSGHAPEVEMWKSVLLSLEERLRTYQQGGYSTNLAPAKLVGKLFTSIDRSIHRMMGPTSPLPTMPQSSVNGKESNALASSQSTMAMSSLVPSASVEGISECAGDDNRKNMHARSISEPDFGRKPKQDPKESSSSDAESKVSPSRFGRIGSHLLKSVSWMSRSRQAKLGETNKFYYDEKLKRWVEEGADPPAEEVALPPPPPTASFQNGAPDYNINNALKNPSPVVNGSPEARSPIPLGHSSGIPMISPGPNRSSPVNGLPEAKSSTPLVHSSGIPSIPPSPNQFSARGRMGVRSRYVDTFNKGGGGTAPSSFQSLPVPNLKPLSGAKFFVPTATASTDEPPVDATKSDDIHEAAASGEPSSSTFITAPFSSSSTPATSPPGMQFSLSMNVPPSGNTGTAESLANGKGGSLSSHSRRASWSGGYKSAEPLEDGVDASTPFIPNHPSFSRSRSSSGQPNHRSFGDDLHEVAL